MYVKTLTNKNTLSMNIPTDVRGLELSLAMITRSKKNEDMISKTFFKDLEKKYIIQSKEEKDFLSHHKWVCPPTVEGSLLEKSSKMETVDISREDSKNVLLDSKSLDSLACLAQNIVLFDGPTMRTGYNFIRKLITDVRLIGAPSANGVAMSASLYDKYKDAIVIKAPRENREFTENATNHELVVGKILNNLRSIIPNFAFILGSFECGPPIIKPDVGINRRGKDKIMTWCRGGEKVKYMMYENVVGAKSFYDFCKDCTAQEYIDILIQVNYALMVAYKKFGFTHYDLHGENILIKPIKDHPDGVYIPYSGDFVFAKSIATFIDYGSSHIYLPGTETSMGYKSEYGILGNIDFIKHGIYMDRPNPAMDSYRFLNSTIHYMRGRNESVYEQVKNLLYFFHQQTEDINEVLNKKDISNIPYFGDSEYTSRISKFRYENFIRYCREYTNINDMNDPVISGKEYSDELDEHIIFSPNSKNIVKPTKNDLKMYIDTIDELFDIIEPVILYKQYLRDNRNVINKEKISSYTNLLEKIYNRIASQKNFIETLIKDELKSIQDTLDNLSVITYKKIPRREVYVLRTPISLQKYLDDLEKTVGHLDSMDLLQRQIEMIRYIDHNIIHSLGDDIESVTKSYNSHDDRKIILGFIADDAKSINDYLDSKVKHDTIDEKIDMVYESLLAVIPA